MLEEDGRGGGYYAPYRAGSTDHQPTTKDGDGDGERTHGRFFIWTMIDDPLTPAPHLPTFTFCNKPKNAFIRVQKPDDQTLTTPPHHANDAGFFFFFFNEKAADGIGRTWCQTIGFRPDAAAGAPVHSIRARRVETLRERASARVVLRCDSQGGWYINPL
jgi:hypothetical protein